MSYWSQNSGRTTIGLPKHSASVTVLLPPWVMTASTCGRTETCGRNSAPAMLSARRSWSCWGPIETITRTRRAGQRVDQRLHQRDVAGAERAEAQVDERAVAGGERLGHRPRRVGGADARLEVVPRAVQRAGSRVVDRVGIEVEVRPRRGVDELERRAAAGRRARDRSRRTPRAASPCVRRELLPVGVPAACDRRPGSRRRRAGRRGRAARPGCTTRSAPTGRRSRAARRTSTTLSSTITSGRDLADDLVQPVVDVAGAVDERLHRRRDEALELLDRRPAGTPARCRG